MDVLARNVSFDTIKHNLRVILFQLRDMYICSGCVDLMTD